MIKNEVLMKKVPLTKKEMSFRGFKNYVFEDWKKTKKLIPVTQKGEVINSIIEEGVWGYFDKYNPEEIRGYSYCWSVSGKVVVDTEAFPTHWQAMEEFEKLMKKYEERNN